MRRSAVVAALLVSAYAEVNDTNPDAVDFNHIEAFSSFAYHFFPMVRSAERIILLDVGANDGQWTADVLRGLSQTLGGDSAKGARKAAMLAGRNVALARTEVHLFEPQPRFELQLNNVIAGWPNAHVHHAAVWKDDKKNLTFFLSRSSTSASLMPVVARHAGVPRVGAMNLTVRTINLAAFLAERLPMAPDPIKALVGFKLDVEAAEFELLPHLIVSGVLCRMHIIVIEWHLNALPPLKRLAGLALRLSIASQLKTGCEASVGSAPIVIHEGAPINNWEQIVPGLWDVALFHNGTPVPGELPSRRVRNWEGARLWVAKGGEAG